MTIPRQSDAIRTLSVLFVLIALVIATPAEALIIDHMLDSENPTAPINTSAPADDPGWYRTAENRSAIYLGNQWVLSAKHAGAAGTITLPGGHYQAVPGSAITLSNPSNFPGLGLTSESDLQLWRIKPETTTGLTPEQADPNLAADQFGAGTVTIGVSGFTLGREVTIISNGRTSKVDTNHPYGHTEIGGDVGIEVDLDDANRIKAWGRNRIDNASVFTGGSSSAVSFNLNVGGNRGDVVAKLVQFDSDQYTYSNADTPVEFEAHGASGDSGGSVFYQQAGQWLLGGILVATSAPQDQSGRLAGFGGNATIFADLTHPHYRDQINALLANNFTLFEAESGLTTDQTGYSINGDINLDGVVSGDGSGDPLTDDVAAFVAGWRHEQQVGDVLSWQQGDLNLDGVTDLSDFALLRDAFNGTVTPTQLSMLLGVTTVPEPATLVLAALAGAAFLRRRGA
ncbi:MAG: PEP-CTERM sorting domain-containing protein [Planctomycetota bacterium]